MSSVCGGFPHNDELESSMMVECGLGYLERAELDERGVLRVMKPRIEDLTSKSIKPYETRTP